MTGRTHSSFGRTSSVLPGTLLNNVFQVDRALSAGGMGEVYRGHNIHTHDPVAIKIVLPEFAQDEMILELFRKEARVLNHLHHEAIVRYYVFAIDAELKRPFLAMEFVEGPSLAERIKLGPLDPASVGVLQRRLADGLQKAHEAGVIHRDIAPDNIILPDGRVERAKIIDFGIARSAVVGGGTLLGSNFAGKYNFASPEQFGLFGGDVTDRSDIYSLGLVLAACLRGQALDMSGTPVEVIEKRRSVPDLSGIEAPMRSLLEAMLQPDPQDRIASMADVAAWRGPDETQIAPKPVRPVSQEAAERSARPPTVPPAQPPQSPPAQQHSPAAVSRPPREPRPARELPSVKRPQKKKSRRGLVLASVIALALLGGVAAAIYAPVDLPAAWPQLFAWRELPQPTPEPAVARPTEVVEPPPVEPVDRAAQINSFLEGYRGAGCLFASPVDVAGDKVTIIGFGQEGPFRQMLSDFKQRFGLEPDVRLREVSGPQCIVVEALNRLIGNGAGSPTVELDRDEVRSGQNLSGTVSGFGDRHLEILVVDNQGLVQKLQYEKAGDAASFNVLLEGELTHPEPQLIVSVASAEPLQSLAAPWPGGFTHASDIIPELLDEVEKRPNDVAASAKYFIFGGNAP